MSIFKTHKSNNFVVLDKGFLNDNRLSLKAKGLLSLMFSYPDNWQFYEKELVKHTSDKITALRSGIQELMHFGYITRNRLRNNKGQFREYEYNVFEIPKLENPTLDNPTSEKQPLLNNNITKNNIIKNNNGVDINTDTFIDDLIAVYFDLYLEYYNRHHPQLTKAAESRVKQKIYSFMDKYSLEIDLELWKDMVLTFFNNVNTNGNINHFTEENILKYRYYEAGGSSLDY